MKKLSIAVAVLMGIFVSCEKEEESVVIIQGDYPVKEYYLERDPKVNVWGAGMDFVHDECQLAETDLDYKYLESEDTFLYDIIFYVVKAYYYDSNGDLKSEGCPAMLLSADTKACKLGEGVEFFDSLTTITEEMTDQLLVDPVIDYEQYKDETTGFYNSDLLYADLENCIIGQSFRSDILEVPEGKTEQEVQAVYLVETVEGAYVKFMVKEFKPAKPQEKQTLVRWQVISE
jgi:hypothetical protein